MKKLLLTLLSVLMVFTLATTNVFAEGDADTQDTELTYKIDSTYTWSVPASATLSTTDTDIEVELKSTSLAEGDGVRINVSSANGFKVKNGTTELAYTLKDGETTITGNETVIIEAITPTTKTLKAKLNAEGAVAGKYSDTLTFTASISPVGYIYDGEGTMYQLLTKSCVDETTGSLDPDIVVKENSKLVLPRFLTDIGASCYCTEVDSRGINIAQVVIPNTVTEIESSAFQGCENLNTVIFEEGSIITTIDDQVFKGCVSLESITIPNSVTSIGSAFNGCKKLATVIFEEGSKLTTIGSEAFDGSAITSITIPASVTTIGIYAFSSTPLTSITIPANVTTIGNYAFNSCTELASITIPDTVTTIGEYAFNEVENVIIDLTKITDPDTQSNFPWGAVKINEVDWPEVIPPWEG